MKKKKRIPLIALIIAAVSLVLSAVTLVLIPEDQSQRIDALYQENAQLRARVDELTTQLDMLQTVVSLKDWTIAVTPWPDSTGADIVFTATPSEYQPGVSADFLVLLEGHQVAAVPCQWDGYSFTASASLNAADGYSYYCVLSSSGGTQKLPLATPEDPTQEIPVYLSSSITAFCNLAVNDWEEKDNILTLTDAYAQIQLPLICSSGSVEIASSDLVLRLNGAAALRIPIRLAPSEVPNSYELAVTDTELPLESLAEGDTLELYLEVSLTDGRNLSAFGISWYLEDGTISSSVG